MTTSHPALKASVLHADTADGAYVAAGTRSFLLKGRNLYPVVARILDAIDGSTSLAGLRATAPAAVHPLFDRLVASLDKGDMLTRGPREAVDGDTPYASARSYLREEVADWEQVFEDWSMLPVVIGGASDLVPLAVLSMLRSGAANIEVVADTLTPADLAAIRAQAAMEAPLHRHLRCGFIAAAESMTAAGDTSLFVHLAHGPIDAATVDHVVGGVAAHAASVLGGQHAGAGAIVSLRREEPRAWLDLMIGEPREPGLPPAILRAVLANMVAFEALQMRIDARHSSRRDRPPGGRIRIVRPDGSIVSNTARIAALARPTLDDRLLRDQDPALTDGSDRAPWFHPTLGCFAWRDLEQADFPLAVRAIRMNDAGRAHRCQSSTELLHWGLDTASADRRTFAAALVALETDRRSFSTGADRSQLIAATSREEAGALAFADLVVSADGFLARHPPRRLEPRSVDDPSAQVLLRLARLYTGRLPMLWLAGSGDPGAWTAWALAGSAFAAAIHATATGALVEALGDALAALQVGSQMTRQRRSPLTDLAGMRPVLEHAAPIDLAAALATSPLPTMRHIFHAVDPTAAVGSDIMIGFVQALE